MQLIKELPFSGNENGSFVIKRKAIRQVIIKRIPGNTVAGIACCHMNTNDETLFCASSVCLVCKLSLMFTLYK